MFSHPDRAKDIDGTLFEERITLWKSDSFEGAMSKAEEEGKVYAVEANCEFLSVSDSFHIFDEEIKEGSELWATMRGSKLSLDLYRGTFCCTPLDRSQKAPPLGVENQ